MMSAADAYEKAHRQAVACYERDKEEGADPYLPVLDKILQGITIKKETRSQLREIPLAQVVGTKTEGRTQAFASNFMPLLEGKTEFADKWMNLYRAQMNEGIRDAVKVYELFGYYFVQEGNKRVSVLKFCKAPSITADVREVIIDPNDLDENGKALYQAYLDFEKAVPLHDIVMSSPKNYERLLKILDVSPDDPMSKTRAKDFHSLFVTFSTGMDKTGIASKLQNFKAKDVGIPADDKLPKTMGDAFLQYLKTYGFSPDEIITQSEMVKELEKLFDVNPERNGTYLMTDTAGSERRKGILSSLIRGPLLVAFILAGNAKSSTWTAEHLSAIETLKEQMGDQIKVEIYEECNTKDEIKDAINKAIAHYNEVIFTTSPTMLQIANQYAASHPRLKILNNSLNLDTGLLRTYWAREYEVQFLLGLLAGIMTEDGKIGYLASYPILGTVANINAFAMGAEMTNPRAKIYLDWTTTTEAMLANEPHDIDLVYIEGNKFDTSVVEARKYGLFNVGTGSFYNVATIQTNWAVFYEKIIKSILNNTWSLDQQKSGNESINYWWGLSNGLFSLHFSDNLPLQVRRLCRQFRNDMEEGTFMPYEGDIQDQEGHIHQWSKGVFLPHIAKMDWLASNVVGSIPKVSQLMEDAKEIVALHGVNKTTESE